MKKEVTKCKIINKSETLLTRDKVKNCKQVKIASCFVKEKLIFTVIS